MASDLVPLINGIAKLLSLALIMLLSLSVGIDVIDATHIGRLGQFSAVFALMCALAAWWAFWSLIDWLIHAAGGRTFNEWFMELTGR